MFKLSFAALSGIALLAGAGQSARAATPTFYVGTCKPGKADFTTIQAAVSAVPPGSTINVCPGVYPEQVTITQPLILKGVQSGGNAQVMITAPAGGTLVATVAVSISTVAQVAVENSGGMVDISGLTVDGTGITHRLVTAAGILYNSSPGKIDHVVVQNLPAVDGGVIGIDVRDDFAASPTNVVQNSTVSFPQSGDANFDSVGIYTSTFLASNTVSSMPPSGGTITASVTDNYVGAASVGAQISGDVVATVTGNVIDGATVLGTEGLVFGAEGVLAIGISGKINNNSITNFELGVSLESTAATGTTTVSNNTVVTSESGIGLFKLGGTVTVNGNQLISPANVIGSLKRGIDFGCTNPLPTVAGNTISGALIGLANVPSGTSLQQNAGMFINVPTVEQVCQ